MDVRAGNCDSAVLSAPAWRGRGGRWGAGHHKHIGDDSLQSSFAPFLRNTKHKHWPLSRRSRTNISLDKHLEDKSWHEDASRKKKKKKRDASSEQPARRSAEELVSHEALPQINTTSFFISVLRRDQVLPAAQVSLLGLIKVQRVWLSVLSDPSIPNPSARTDAK